MAKASRESKRRLARQLMLTDETSDLFAKVSIELTAEERGLILEARYYRQLTDLGLKYGEKKALDVIAADRQGVTDPRLLAERQRLEYGPQVQSDYMELARKNAELSMRSGWGTGVADVNAAIDSDTAAAARTAPPHLRAYAIESQPSKVVLEDVEKWRMRQDVARVLSNREGYSGDMYSVFFGGPESKDDEKFFTSLRDSLERGLSERDAVKRAQAALKDSMVSTGRMRNIVRTETQRAMQAGIVESTRSTGLIVAYLFDGIKDDRETPYCSARHGLLILADDEEMLQRCTPPLHYQCRSSLVPLTRRGLESRGGYEQAEIDRITLDSAPDFDW